MTPLLIKLSSSDLHVEVEVRKDHWVKIPLDSNFVVRLPLLLREHNAAERKGKKPRVGEKGYPTAYAIEKAWDLKPSRRVGVDGYDKDVTLEDLLP